MALSCGGRRRAFTPWQESRSLTSLKDFVLVA
jgi:hypothetical protein